MAGASAAGVYGAPRPRRACSPSTGCLSTTKAKSGSGPAGAPDHRAKVVREVARALEIDLVRLPGCSPDLMPVEALWRRLREDVASRHGHAGAEELTRRAGAFAARLNRAPSSSPTGSGSRTASTLARKNCASRNRCGSNGWLGDVQIHDLCHAHASIAVMGGESLNVVGKALGHVNHQTTQRHAHRAADLILAATSRTAAHIENALSERRK